MSWDDIIPGQLWLVTILGLVVLILLVLLFLVIYFKFIRKKVKAAKLAKKYASKYPLVQQALYRAKFKYTLVASKSDKYNLCVKVTYECLDTVITYHIFVPRGGDYLTLAKRQIKELIRNDTLCIYTLKIVPYQEFKIYAAR